MAGSGSDSSLELALQRMTQALKLAKQREEEFAASRNARSAAETDLRRDCDDCRRPCACAASSVTAAPPILAGRRLQSCGQSRSGSRRCSRSQHAQHASLQALKFFEIRSRKVARNVTIPDPREIGFLQRFFGSAVKTGSSQACFQPKAGEGVGCEQSPAYVPAVCNLYIAVRVPCQTNIISYRKFLRVPLKSKDRSIDN
ncbi:VIP2 [Symbiodinium sp. CCMP2592]|nr:VIP2 [Symbiodinium sp. CCMP2592]